MVTHQDLCKLGFVRSKPTRDYVLALRKDYILRVEIKNDRARLFIEYGRLSGIVDYADVIYMNTYGFQSLRKFIESQRRIIEQSYNDGLEKSKSQLRSNNELRFK